MKHVVLFASILGAATSGHAFNQYIQEVPNGATFRCLTCHTLAGGGEGWNAFGQELLKKSGANPDANPGDQNLGFDSALGTPADHWADLCGSDSDGDGALDGEELGDPDCAWTAGDANPAGDISNPGDDSSVPENPGAGEGEGEGEAGGCAATPVDSPVCFLAGLGLIALVRRRR